jgi:RND family efflux transporter MFP subunit
MKLRIVSMVSNAFSFRVRWAWMSALALWLALTVAACGGGATSEDSAGGNAQAQTAEAGENGKGSKESTSEDAGAGKGDAEKDENDSGKKKRRERTTSINAARAVRTDLVIPIVAEGKVRARHSAEIRTETEGKLLVIHAGEGEMVRKGQLIAKLDGREREVAAEEARAKYLEALSRLAVEEDTLQIETQRPPHMQEAIDLLAEMERRGEITREERLAREIAMDVEALKDGTFRIEIVAARSGVSAARTALERARLELERTEIRAPFTGIVTGLLLSEGEQVTKGQTICTVVNNTDIEADVGVLEADLGHLAVGRPALLIVSALNDTLRVKIDVISPQFDRSTRTCQVLMRFSSDTGRIMPGMFVRAIIAGPTFEDKLVVPKEAILSRDGRPLLFKVEGDRAKWLYLRLGKRNDYVVEVERVLQGGTLSPGDLVVVSDHLTLAHDAKIKLRKTVPISDPWSSAQKEN